MWCCRNKAITLFKSPTENIPLKTSFGPNVLSSTFGHILYVFKQTHCIYEINYQSQDDYGAPVPLFRRRVDDKHKKTQTVCGRLSVLGITYGYPPIGNPGHSSKTALIVPLFAQVAMDKRPRK